MSSTYINTMELPKLYLYTNMAAADRVVIFVNLNFSVPVA